MPIHLPNAVHGHVVTRFPPEPSWHLDIGHCKAALMNQFIAGQFQGEWILRFDDTNPKTCSRPCVESYIQDMPLLGLNPHKVSHASDYFQQMIDDVEPLIQSGFLYADDTPVDTMRDQRLSKQPSAARDLPLSASLEAWASMRAGSAEGQSYCLRFRLQPDSENGALRDPVAYRVILEPHYKTGTQYKVYPTYDYACPWLDAAEGVTHALRTLEFRDRDILYDTVQQSVIALHPGWRPSTIWEFPRIHMAWAPQAKVHQRALLSAGLVDGPTDPRLPTLRGLMRGGCHPDALRTFLLEQVTPARKETYHSWDKLWTINRRLLDPTAARHMAVLDQGRALLHVIAFKASCQPRLGLCTGGTVDKPGFQQLCKELLDQARSFSGWTSNATAPAVVQQQQGGPEIPEPATVQWKQGHIVKVVRYKDVWIDEEDAKLLTEGDEVTLLAWGTVQIVSVNGITKGPKVETSGGQHHDAHQPELAHGRVVAAAAVQERDAAATGKDSRSSTPPRPQAAPALPSPLPPPPAAAPAAAAAAAAAATETLSHGTFEKFKDVLALRDEIMRAKCFKGGRYSFTSSVASTAGSTAVPPSAVLDQEFDLMSQGQSFSSTGPEIEDVAAVDGLIPQQQQQQQQVPDQPQHTSKTLQCPTTAAAAVAGDGASSSSHQSATDLIGRFDPAGDPKRSKLKIHWLPALPGSDPVLLPLKLVYYSHPIAVDRVVEEVDVVAQFNRDSRREYLAWGDPSLLESAKTGAVIQLQRKGLFIVDEVIWKAAATSAVSAAEEGVAVKVKVPTGSENFVKAAATADRASAVAAPAGEEAGYSHTRVSDVEQIILIAIPDGHTKHELSVKQ